MEKIWNLKHIILLLIISSCVGNVIGQNTATSDTIAVAGKILATDNLEHVYVVDSNDVVNQFNSNGKLLHQFSTIKFGPLHSIDASNPQKILIFYKSFNTIIILDNTLTEIAKIDLQFSDFELEAICASNKNDIWAYNSSNAELIKLNARGEEITKTTGLEQFFLEDNMPTYMVERNNYVFIKTTKGELFIFDTFGTFYRKIQSKSAIKDFQVYGERIFCLTRQNNLIVFSSKTGSMFLTEDIYLKDAIHHRKLPGLSATLYQEKLIITKTNK